MGVADTVTIKYLQQNEIFADAFNFLVYGGRKVIDPDSLVELDTREIDVPYGGADGAGQPVQKTRDVIKSVTARTDSRAAYLVLAIESQSNIHYAMPVKNLVYDALQYAKQVQEAVSSHKQAGEILSYVPDYKINLIAPAAIPDTDFDKFSTTLKEVLSFIKYSNDADKLEDLLSSDEGFRKLGRKEVDVLNCCVSAKLAMSEREEVLDVCEAIRIMNERAAEKAAASAKVAANVAVAKRLLRLGKLSYEEIAEASELSVEEVEALASKESA